MAVHLKIEGHNDHDVPDGSTVWISGGSLKIEVAQLIKTVLVQTSEQLQQVLQAPVMAPTAVPRPRPPLYTDQLRAHPTPALTPSPGPMLRSELPKVRFNRGQDAKYQEILAVVWEVMHTGQWYTTGDLTDVVFTMCPLVAGRSRPLVVGEVGRLMARLYEHGFVEQRPASANSSGGKGAPLKYRRRDR